MKILFLFFTILSLWIADASAGIGDTDNRYYVTDEMWTQEPYKKFVYFEVMAKADKELVPSGHCSAQYISPNLILSAGHCTSKDADGYRVKNYKQEEFLVELIETPYDGKIGSIGDWAVWLVTAPKYYSDSFFNLKSPTKTIDVLNAGWGWARILDDNELSNIRNIFKEIEEEQGKIISIDSASVELSRRMQKKGMEAIYDLKSRLKASECKIVFEDCDDMSTDLFDGLDKFDNLSQKQKNKWLNNYEKKQKKLKNICNNQHALKHKDTFPNILATTCDSWAGNSGGGYVSLDGKYLYGVCSSGSDSFTDTTNTDYITSTLQFEKRIKQLIKEYNSKNPVEDNIAKIPQNIFREDTNDTATETKETTQQKMLQRMDNHIKRLTTETNDLDKKLTDILPNIQNITDEQLLKFLDKMSEYKIKTERLEYLKKAYKKAKEREQSTANKLLSGAAIGAAGVGGMMLASGLAEQAADADAETAMRAYLETFYCKVGDGGKNIKGGTRGAIVPGGNELIKLYSEYVSLANDLKARKTALGMKPGIESEAILDSATSGLYDDISVGKTGGAYASLARALQNPDGEDAKKWSEQKAASASDVKTGAIVGGVGAVGGAVGNLIINKDK